MDSADRELIRSPVDGAVDVSYERAIVTFIDILGFRALVSERSSTEVAAAIKRLQESVQSPAEKSARGPTRPIRPSRVHAFSDCVVRVRPVTHAADFARIFIRELSDLASIQAALAQAGVFVRGGVTLDQIHSTQTVVFGPGLIRAYELEARLAHVPRIIVDPATIQAFRSRPVPVSRMRRDITGMRKAIRQGEDGLWFVDYLRSSANVLETEPAVRALLKAHREEITKAAATIDTASSILPKYLWAAKYHNASCKRLLGRTSVPGITLSKNELPSFERLRRPLILKS